jgi:hypothetical protein
MHDRGPLPVWLRSTSWNSIAYGEWRTPNRLVPGAEPITYYGRAHRAGPPRTEASRRMADVLLPMRRGAGLLCARARLVHDRRRAIAGKFGGRTFDEIVNGGRIAVAPGQQRSTVGGSVGGSSPAQEPPRKAAKAMHPNRPQNVMFAASGPYYSIVILGAARARPFSSVAFTFAAMAR